MAHCTGWILDVSIEQNRAVIWIKTTEGNVLRLMDKYHPNFYVLPKDGFDGLIGLCVYNKGLIMDSPSFRLSWTYTPYTVYDLASVPVQCLMTTTKLARTTTQCSQRSLSFILDGVKAIEAAMELTGAI